MVVGLREILGAVVYDTCIDLLLSQEYFEYCENYQYKIGGLFDLHTFVPDISPNQKGSLIFYHYSDENEISGIFNNTFLLQNGMYKYPAFINISDSPDNVTPLATEMQARFVLVAPVNSKWTKDEQETIIFQTIFDKIERLFFKNLERLPYIIKDYDFPKYSRYKGYHTEQETKLKDEFGDYIAYVLFDDLKITIDNNLCKQQKDVILQKFNNLKNFLQ